MSRRRFLTRRTANRRACPWTAGWPATRPPAQQSW